MWWLLSLFGTGLLLAYWRRYFWLAGYLLTLVGGLVGWYLADELALLNWLLKLQMIMYGLVSVILWGVGGWFWRFAHQLLRRRGESMAYRILQLVVIILLVLPVITLGWQTKLIQLLWLSVGYFAIGLAAYVVGSLLLLSYPRQRQVQYLIVLGSGIRADGQLTATLRRRVQRAAKIYHGDKTQYLVVSGGQGSDEPISEAQAMASALLKLNVPHNAIILEAHATSTRENLQFSLAQLPATATVGMLTNDFHLLRAALYGRRLRRPFSYYGATTPLTYLLRGALRDYLALLVMTRWAQLVGWLVLLGLEIWL
ncbi:YdcF family protein [Loigolactobacillus coryniformis]|uniref:YdcF family protein n=1 Tax=Loigolactobacillus coryniformis TaxID=1610 RepID=UPI0023428A2F|nr:YdcF family protein [Loigolactobacillus coryniformis]MDC4185427.1 YdcF family protein [Loigolactobacillus coryniformis]